MSQSRNSHAVRVSSTCGWVSMSALACQPRASAALHAYMSAPLESGQRVRHKWAAFQQGVALRQLAAAAAVAQASAAHKKIVRRNIPSVHRKVGHMYYKMGAERVGSCWLRRLHRNETVLGDWARRLSPVLPKRPDLISARDSSFFAVPYVHIWKNMVNRRITSRSNATLMPDICLSRRRA